MLNQYLSAILLNARNDGAGPAILQFDSVFVDPCFVLTSAILKSASTSKLLLKHNAPPGWTKFLHLNGNDRWIHRTPENSYSSIRIRHSCILGDQTLLHSNLCAPLARRRNGGVRNLGSEIWGQACNSAILALYPILLKHFIQWYHVAHCVHAFGVFGRVATS